MNYLVSPYYPESGGTVIDWLGDEPMMWATEEMEEEFGEDDFDEFDDDDFDDSAFDLADPTDDDDLPF
ncbi:MAG: hypothetical protein HYZ23_05380 [Chloroflexi bacterium]|nr:hypothetical protein [Chloroflexota bacterium]